MLKCFLIQTILKPKFMAFELSDTFTLFTNRESQIQIEMFPILSALEVIIMNHGPYEEQ